MGKKIKFKFYAVRKGRKPGIYESWDECKNQTDGFSCGEFKGFNERLLAEAYMLPQDGVGLHFITSGTAYPQMSNGASDFSKKRKFDDVSNNNAPQKDVDQGYYERAAGEEYAKEDFSSIVDPQSIVDELNTILNRKSLEEGYFSELATAIERAAKVDNIDVEDLEAARVYLKKLKDIKEQQIAEECEKEIDVDDDDDD